MAKTFFQQSPVSVGSGTLFSPEIDTSDFERAAIEILRMSEYFANTAIPLEGAKHIARDDMDKRFDTETAPDGSKWRKLSEGHGIWDRGYAYKKLTKQVRKVDRGDEKFGGFIHPILTLEGELRHKATDESAWSVSGDSLWFSTANLPFYWAAHQDPMDHGRGDDLPMRQFIGLSTEAEDKIIAEVEEWIAAGMTMAESEYKIGSSYTGSHVSGTITSIAKGAGGKPQYRIGNKWGPMV